MDGQEYYDHCMKTISYKLTQLIRDVNQGQSHLQDGRNPGALNLPEVENYIKTVFSGDDNDLSATPSDYMATLNDAGKKQVAKDRKSSMKWIADIKKNVLQTYNQFHYGAYNVLDMDAADGNQSDDNADNDIQGMGLPEVDSESDTGSGLPDRGSMFHAGLNRLYGGANPSPLALRLKQITDKWSARMREAHVPYEELFREMRRQISVYEQRIQQLQAANSGQINNPLASPNPWAANEVRDLAQKIDYNNAVMEAADNEYTGIKYNLREQQDAEVAALEIELQDPSHSLYSNSRRMRRGDMS
tara:strand:- start:2230 stop:3135 length:906 start_codon:yes stop_codon:yes gene_type:complete